MTLQADEEAYAVPGERSIVDTINPETGRTRILGQTFDEVRARYPAAERVRLADWLAVQAERQETPIIWTRTTAAKYHEMLEILPPAVWIGGAFLVGEPYDHSFRTGEPRFPAYWMRGSEQAPTMFTPIYLVASRPLTVRELKKEIGR